MHWPLYVALAALALGAALAGLRESAAVPWFMVAVGLVASVFGLGAGLAALGLASLLLFFQGAMNPSSLAALLLAALLAHQVGKASAGPTAGPSTWPRPTGSSPRPWRPSPRPRTGKNS